MKSLFYPPHPPRVETAAYRRVHRRLVVEENRGCAVCGVTYEKLKRATARSSRANPWHASAIETHHAIVEWAMMRAVNLRRFNERIVRAMRAVPGADSIYGHDFTTAKMRAWIDHHPDNLMVLCDVHHRHVGVGVHAVTAPRWSVQMLLGGCGMARDRE